MVLILDPRLAVVWRSPDQIQVGVDDPRARVDRVSVAEERMLAALRLGITRSGLEMIGRQSGADTGDVAAFLAALGPAVVTTGATGGPAPLIAIDGDGPTAQRLRVLATDAGFVVAPAPARGVQAKGGQAAIAAAVLFDHFVISPPRAGAWLRRDIPHLPVVFGDSEVCVGPMISPGASPCWHCQELHRRDQDPGRAAIASQLLGRRAGSESSHVAWEIAALVTRILVRSVAPHYQLTGTPICSVADPVAALGLTSRHVVVATGAITTRPVSFHPECGCRALPGTATVSAVPAPPRIRHKTAAARVSRA